MWEQQLIANWIKAACHSNTQIIRKFYKNYFSLSPSLSCSNCSVCLGRKWTQRSWKLVSTSVYFFLSMCPWLQIHVGSVCGPFSDPVHWFPVPAREPTLAHAEGFYPDCQACAEPDPWGPEHWAGVWKHQDQHWGGGEGERRWHTQTHNHTQLCLLLLLY